MICGNCGNQNAWSRHWTIDSEGCNACDGQHTYQGTPDVYFKEPYLDEHLGSEEHPGPKMINSRAEKAYWLKKCNLRESGDRVHGASKFDPVSHRHAMESLRRNPHVRRND